MVTLLNILIIDCVYSYTKLFINLFHSIKNMKTGIRVFDIMTKKPTSVGPELSVKKAANLMLKKRIGGLVVTKNKKIVGIITEKDLMSIIAKGKDPNKIQIKKVMNKRVKTIKSQEDIYNALLEMRKKDVRRLPVLDKKQLVGLLTVKDILKVQPSLFDLLAEKLNIKSLRQKRSGTGKYFEGECEICGNYSQLTDISGKLICEGCKDQE
ncbi:hypothetical protein CL621_03125 [archaeon]|nr:hypothetical protein [archaeon]